MPRLTIDEQIELLERGGSIKYRVLAAICEKYFTFKRQDSSSHRFYWCKEAEQPINIQPGRSDDAKPYQVKQVVACLKQIRGAD